jgi:alkyldihydroxyacetonephosphate synthase
MVPAARRLSFWRWGYEDVLPDPALLERTLASARAFFGEHAVSAEPRPAPRLEAISLPPPRVSLPAALAAFATIDPHERARHTLGRAYRDIVRGLACDFSCAPDLVAFPEDEADVARLVDHCAGARIAVIPFGGGSSVCGGVEPRVDGHFTGALSLDLSRMGRVLEIDAKSRAACIEAGAFGPAIEDALRPHGLTLRHYPQSFEVSTLGGWIATRSGGHFATLQTHIDDFVESIRVVTPKGTLESRRLPASGAGPQLERLYCGSEGTLGVITRAWMRLQDRPRFRASASLSASDFLAGARAVRALAQSGLHPSNCRLLDPVEAFTSRAGSGAEAVLLVAFESAHHEVDVDLERALACARDHGATLRESTTRDGERRPSQAENWRTAFLHAPYLRDALIQRGLLVETFETAVTWDRFDAFHTALHEETTRAVFERCGAGIVSARITHAYPDGAAPYYTVIAPAPRGHEVAAWDEIKTRVTDAIVRSGGTVTHHHAVGRDLRDAYAREVPREYREMLAAAKHAVDPAGILNPGVLLS